MIKFFKEVWQTPNQLLWAVLSDIQVPEHLAGCKALGLVNKVVTGPLWRILETSDISILEMNEYFQMLVTHLDLWSLDSTDVLSGNAIIFPDFPPSEDEIWKSLTASSEYDVIAQELFKRSSVVSQYYSSACCMIICLVANLTIPLTSCKKKQNLSLKLIQLVSVTSPNLTVFSEKSPMLLLYLWRL